MTEDGVLGCLISSDLSDFTDHLMFDEDPGSVKQGEAHWVMAYMRAWRPTFIYVSYAHCVIGIEHSRDVLKHFPERIPTSTRALGCLGPRLCGQIVQERKRMEKGTTFSALQLYSKAPLTPLQFATNLIQSCRTRETKTPFLNTALRGADGFVGRPLTDSELAEESMGGMFGGSGTTANTLAYLLWATLRQSELVKRLRKELQDAFPESRDDVPDAAVSRWTVIFHE